MIKWNEVLKKRLWPNGGIIPEFTWMNWKKTPNTSGKFVYRLGMEPI